MMVDSANPNCAGASDMITNGQITVSSSADASSVTIKRNSDGGFDVTQTNADGSSVTVKTGPYDAVGNGYPIVSTVTITPAGKGTDGALCGIPGKPACGVSVAADAETIDANASQQSQIDALNNSGKSLLDGIDPGKFNWSFIPNIPTAECVNPHVKNPLTSATKDVEICGYFNKFAFFLKAVLAVLCVYGCVRQIQSAMRA